MNQENGIGTTYPSTTYKKSTSCLNLYITVGWGENKKIEFVRIVGNNKSGDCGCSWLESLSDILTFSIRRIRNEHEAKAIIKNLRYHRCNKITPNKDHIVSCVDAIGQVIERVLDEKAQKDNKEKEA